MRDIVKVVSNALLVIGGFFVVFFGVSKVTQNNDDTPIPFAGNADIAYADVPYSQASYGDSSSGDGGDSGGDGGK